MPVITTLQFRHGLAATWTSVNPILSIGELGVEIDTEKFKIGDGVTAWNSLAYSTVRQNSLIFQSLGDGSDGNVVISSGITTLTRNMYYNNLTINGTGSLNPSGFEIFVAGTLDLSAAMTGAITATGLPGGSSDGLHAGAAPAAPTPAGSVGAAIQGVVGVQGTATTSTIGKNANTSTLNDGGNTGNAGNGGNSNIGTGNTGGTGGIATSTFPINTYTTHLIEGATLISAGMGGASGASGFGNGHFQGGGSGAGGNGGGIVAIYANIIYTGTNTNVGVIQANGGAGGNGAQYVQIGITGGGGGGSGGGGGWIYIAYNTLTGTPITNSLQANGGAGGNGGNGENQTTQLLTRESTNQGSTWTNVDQYLSPGTDTTQASAMSNRADSAGNVYSVGWYRTTAGLEVWITRQSPDNGVTWNIVDTFIYSAGKSSEASSCWVDTLGNIYVSGWGVSGADTYWITRQSTNNGASWTTVDTFLYAGAAYSEPNSISQDSSGNIYVVGFALVGGGTYHWIVRQAAIATINTWNTIQDYLPGGGVASCEGITTDSLGNVYALGETVISGTQTWVVQQTTVTAIAAALPGMPTWTQTDSYLYTGGITSNPNSMFTDLLNNVYAIGYSIDGSNIQHWIVRQSTNQGTTWITVDDYYNINGTYAYSGTVDALGNIYVVGSLGFYNWVTRKSTNNGSTWTTVDLSVLEEIPAGVGVDNLGNIYVTGYIITPSATTLGLGGYGGAGGNGGTIFVLQSTTSTILVNTANNSSTGSAGSANSGATGGAGGAGGITQGNI